MRRVSHSHQNSDNNRHEGSSDRYGLGLIFTKNMFLAHSISLQHGSVLRIWASVSCDYKYHCDIGLGDRHQAKSRYPSKRDVCYMGLYYLFRCIFLDNMTEIRSSTSKEHNSKW